MPAALLKFIGNLVILGRVRDDPGPVDWSRVKSVLVVRSDNIGDVVLSTPCLEALRRALPQAKIGVMVCGLTADVVRYNPFVDRVHVYHKAKHGFYRRKLRALWEQYRVMRRVRRERYDLALGLRAVFSASQGWLVYHSRARWRLGRQAPPGHRHLGFLYNLTLPEDVSLRHEVRRSLDVLRFVGLDTDRERLYLSVPEPIRAEVDAFLAGLGTARDRKRLVGLNISRWAYRADRTWPDDNYAALIQSLMSDDRFGLVVSHAPADETWVETILESLAERPPRFSSPELIRFAALCQACDLVITPEGGPMHVAAAVGAPLVVLWGRNLVSQWGPWGVDHEIVGSPDEVGSEVGEVGVAEVLRAVDRLEARR
ncbi:MAG: glycosyltransferase family 9 protein [Proteobacteria bacterium]|nr:glycosyltransferase family 9 protein [Pseudomonadota bacterium]MBU1740985.1 glycosyltransferase family 9 protein [Pseudomonadota bacterium]